MNYNTKGKVLKKAVVWKDNFFELSTKWVKIFRYREENLSAPPLATHFLLVYLYISSTFANGNEKYKFSRETEKRVFRFQIS